MIRLLTNTVLAQAPAEATAALRDIAEVNRGSELAWSSLARAYQSTDQPDAEARALANIIDMRPANTSYHLRMARAHERAESPSRAADAYAMALAFDPQNTEAASALDRILTAERQPLRTPGGIPIPPPLTPAPSSSPFLASGPRG